MNQIAAAIAALILLPAVTAQPAQAAALPVVVNDTRDLPDSSIGNGVCATSTFGP